MTTTLNGTVIDGELKLDEPLTLPNQSRVKVAVTSGQASATAIESGKPKQTLAEFFDYVDGLNIHMGERLTRDQMHDRD